MLSRSHFNRRLHLLTDEIAHLFESLGQAWKTIKEEVFLIDPFPNPSGDNIRISRSRLYPLEATNKTYRCYIASKHRFFYGLKLHLLTTSQGRPVEMRHTPGSHSDVQTLDYFSIELPEQARLYDDKAYNDY